MLDQAEAQGLSYVVTRALLESVRWRDTLGEDDEGAVRAVQEAAVRRDLVWERAAARAIDALSERCRPILLKGAGARYLLYDHPGDRTCVDLDVMIPTDQEVPTRAALESRGWLEEAGRRSSDWHVLGMSLGTPLATLSLEIHRALDNPERGRITYHDLVPHCRVMRILGRECLVPEAPAQLLVGATHALRHGLDVPLKSLLDVHRAVAACDGTAEDLRPLHRSPGAGATLGVMLSICEELFGTRVPAAWRVALAPPRISAPLLSLSLAAEVPGYTRIPWAGNPHLRRFWFQALLTGSPVVMSRVLRGWVHRRLRS